LIKMAMLNIRKIIKDENLDATILLQIHDELIFEIKDEDAEALSGKFSQIMIESIQLNVPLKTSINIGKRWSELK